MSRFKTPVGLVGVVAAVGDTSPDPGYNAALAWSTIDLKPIIWNGSSWVGVSPWDEVLGALPNINYGQIGTFSPAVLFKSGDGLGEFEDRYRFYTRRSEWLGLSNISNVTWQGARFIGTRAVGTDHTTPGAVPVGYKLAEFLGGGYNGSYYDATAGMMIFSSEDFSIGNVGSSIGFFTVPNGSTTQGLALWLDQGLGITIPGYPLSRDDGVKESNRYLTVDSRGQVRHQSRFSAFAEVTSPVGSQSNVFAQALRLTANIPYTGNYKVTVSYTWSANTTGNDFISRVQRDDVATIMEHVQEPKDPGGGSVTVANLAGGTFNSGTSQRYGYTRTKVENFTAGIHNIDLDIRGDVNNLECTVYEATIIVEEM